MNVTKNWFKPSVVIKVSPLKKKKKVIFLQCRIKLTHSFDTLRDCFMITFDGFFQEVKPISLEVALSTYVQESTASFLKSGSSCNSGCPTKTEIRQFSGVSCSCSERDTLLASLSVVLVVPVLPEKCRFGLGDCWCGAWGAGINYSTALLNSIG